MAGLGRWLLGMPTPYLLAAIAIILRANVSTRTQIAALLVCAVVAFILVLLPLPDYLRTPEKTRSRVQRIQAWVDSHHRLCVARCRQRDRRLPHREITNL